MSKIVRGLLFVVLGIPGALVFVFSSIALAAKLFDPEVRFPEPFKLLLACVLGALATLIGIGKIKEWLYALVLIAFPFSFWFWLLVNPHIIGGIIPLLAFVGAAAFLTLKGVQYYYHRH